MSRWNYNCENCDDVCYARVEVKSHVDAVHVDVVLGV